MLVHTVWVLSLTPALAVEKTPLRFLIIINNDCWNSWCFKFKMLVCIDSSGRQWYYVKFNKISSLCGIIFVIIFLKVQNYIWLNLIFIFTNIYFCSEVAWTLESKTVLSMINELDVSGKTPVDYASEGKTPRCGT